MTLLKLTAVLALLTWMGVAVGVVNAASRARLVENGYEGVVVGVSPWVESNMARDVIEGLKQMLDDGSKSLLHATHHRAYFRKIQILIPASWTHIEAETADNLIFTESDIRVDLPNRIYQNQPYTMQTGSCGDPGQYIHYTPAYLTDEKYTEWWGPRGNHFVEEWAKFRWGVYDEEGYPDDTLFPQYYSRKQRGGVPVPTYCGKKVEGSWMTPAGKVCAVDQHSAEQRSEQHSEQCSFVPQNCSSVALMSLQFCTSAQVEFCDHDHNETVTHDPEVPTKQNRMCQGRSAWEVIRGHRDFASGANPPLNTTSLQQVGKPHIQIVRQGGPNSVVLLLDYSNAMDYQNRLNRLLKAVTTWIVKELPEDTRLAVVSLSDGATVVCNLTQLDTTATRERVAKSLRREPSGDVTTSAGLRKGLQILSKEKNKIIILASHREQKEPPNLDDVTDDLQHSGVRLVTLSIGNGTNKHLEEIAQKTSGIAYFVDDNNYDFTLEDGLNAASLLLPSHRSRKTTVMENVTQGVIPEGEIGGKFEVESGSAGDLVFFVDKENGSVSDPRLKRPGGSVVPGRYDGILDAWFTVVENAEAGEWEWLVKVDNGSNIILRSKVTLEFGDEVSRPITTRVWTEWSSLAGHHVIMGEVKQGNDPVLYAEVRAEVTLEGSRNTSKYTLLDNGRGADLLKGDGIYSRFLMGEAMREGTLSIKLRVEGTEKTRVYKQNRQNTARGRDRRQAVLNERPYYCCGSTVSMNPEDADPTGVFSRMAAGGSVKVNTMPNADSLRPMEVTDLRVLSVRCPGRDLDTTSMTLFWSASGDDLDSGIVNDYIVGVSTEQLNETNFNQSMTFKMSDLVTPNDFKTKIRVEVFTEIVVNISVDFNPEEVSFLALKAVDEEGYESGISNVVTVRCKKRVDPPTTATTEDTATPTGSSAKGVNTTNSDNGAGTDNSDKEANTENSDLEADRDTTWDSLVKYLIVGFVVFFIAMMIVVVIGCTLRHKRKKKVAKVTNRRHEK